MLELVSSVQPTEDIGTTKLVGCEETPQVKDHDN